MRMNSTPKEWEHIKGIQRLVRRDKADTLIPLGDDAFAAKAPSLPLVMAQDMMVEGVHFQRAFSSAADLGHKSLAVNLSDFAAMGAMPRWAMVSLALPPEMDKSWLDEFYSSMTTLADRFSVEIVGGDLCASPKDLVIDVSLIGLAEKPISRRGAKAGDLLLCSGSLGGSAQGLDDLRQKKSANANIQKHLRPEPRLDLLPQLQKNASEIHALIDVSDGLISECLHLTRQLELGLDLYSDKIPRPEGVSDITKALWGGEDYELLIAIPPALSPAFENWKTLGQFNDQKEIALISADGNRQPITEFSGWQHFVSK